MDTGYKCLTYLTVGLGNQIISDCFALPYFVPDPQSSRNEQLAVIRRAEEFLYIIAKLLGTHMPRGDLKKYVRKPIDVKSKEFRRQKRFVQLFGRA